MRLMQSFKEKTAETMEVAKMRSGVHKGQQASLSNLPSIAISFVVVGITIAIGALINSGLSDQVTDANATQVVQDAQSGLLSISNQLPTIGLVIGAVILLAVVINNLRGL